MEQDLHRYEGEDITVTYDVKRCIHARECVNGLPGVFDPAERPWIDADAAEADEVAEVITRCPTGALQFERADGGPAESVPGRNTVTVVPDGPLYVRGDVEIVDDDGTALLRDTRVGFCRCGASGNKPLCDDSHRDVGFEAPGTVDGDTGPTDEESSGGRLRVTPTPDGPLRIEGAFELAGEEGGRSVEDGAWLCRCGASGNRPFCDGSHSSVGFVSED